MFRLGIKAAIFLLLIIGFAIAIPGHKVAADSANCPDNHGGAIPDSWGINTGSQTHGFASVLVQTIDATNNSATPVSNVGFTINSQRAPVDPGYAYNANDSANGNDPNAKIYNWGPSGDTAKGGGPGSTGRWSSYRFATGPGNGSPGAGGATASSNMYYGTQPNGLGPEFNCTGWLEMGPGVKVLSPGAQDVPSNYNEQDGNNFVLDCEDDESATHPGEAPVVQKSNYFWVNNIDSPNVDNAYGGHWSITVYGLGGNSPNPSDPIYQNGDITDPSTAPNNGPMATPSATANNTFSVTNGMNIRVVLAWHANPPPHNAPNTTSECTYLDVTDGGSATINGKTFTSGNIRTLVKVTDSSGQVMVHNPNSVAPDYVVLNDESKSWSYTPRGPTVNVYVYRQYYHNNDGTSSWSNIPAGSTDGNGQPLTGDQSRVHTNCYSATCTVTNVVGNVPNGPGNAVIAGSNFQVYVQVRNTGIVTLGSPTVNGVGLDAGYLNQGDTGTTRPPITVTAPGSPTNFPMTFTVNDGVAGNLATCSTTVPVYQQFSDTVSASSNLTGPEADAPTGDNYSTTVNISGTSHQVNIPTTSTFCIKHASGAQSCPNSASGGTYTPPSQTAFSGTYTISPGSYVAGDEYCSNITASFSGGYVGPDNSVADPTPPPQSASSCPRITNEPYFKVTNSSVATGGDFGSCTTTGGTLAGYNNNSDSGYDRGASVQLGALSIVPSGISGVASGQTVGTVGSGGTGAMRLTFANNTSAGAPYSAGTDTPTLGGNAGTCQTLTNKQADEPTTALGASTNVASLAGGEYSAGNLSIGTAGTTETMTPNHSVEIFATGNVYIGSNIKYNNTGATVGTVPSLIIHATGNIYIDPAVATLTGTYIAQQTTSGRTTTGGKIYTCGTSGFAAMQPASLYTGCHNQLVVYGSFVADQVNLMRTFGSLRDETPTSGSAGTSYSVNGSNYSSCTYVDAPTACSTTGTSVYDYEDYAVTYQYGRNGGHRATPTVPAGSGYQLTINYSNFQYTGTWPPGSDNDGWPGYDVDISVNGAVVKHDVILPAAGPSYTVNLGTLPQNPSITIRWKNNRWIPANTYNHDPNLQINSIAVGTPQVTAGPPSPLNCSNSPGANTLAGATCAAEVFRFSPEIYLSNPDGGGDGDGDGGLPPAQSITSLPPVL